jgi:hypothetical protein
MGHDEQTPGSGIGGGSAAMAEYDTEKAFPELRAASRASSSTARVYKPGFMGTTQRAMDFLVEHGVEERGIQPLPEDVSWRV